MWAISSSTAPVSGSTDSNRPSTASRLVATSFSTTKGVVATVLHRLADRGEVDYDAPVTAYWPEFGGQGKDRITIRHLLHHTSGLSEWRQILAYGGVRSGDKVSLVAGVTKDQTARLKAGELVNAVATQVGGKGGGGRAHRAEGRRQPDVLVLERQPLERQIGAGDIEVVVAKRGEQVDSDDPDVRFLVLHEGRRYEGVPGTAEFRVVEFLEHGIPYRLPSLDPPKPTPRVMTMAGLMPMASRLPR